MTKILRSYFLSDLHLFARRSSAAAITPSIDEAARHAHTMILGGDIFDFKWSIHPTLDHSIRESIKWLESLIQRFPGCSFYYLLGNHDSHPKFVVELDRLSFRQPRLRWQPYVLRLEHCVFLHGDIVDGEPTHEHLDIRRRLAEDKPQPSLTRHWWYDVAVQAGLHRTAMKLAVRPASVLKKLSCYLADQGLDAKHGVEHIYFGHTHRDMNGVEYQGMTFHNGGASIKGLTFRIIETQLQKIDAQTILPQAEVR